MVIRTLKSTKANLTRKSSTIWQSQVADPKHKAKKTRALKSDPKTEAQFIPEMGHSNWNAAESVSLR